MLLLMFTTVTTFVDYGLFRIAAVVVIAVAAAFATRPKEHSKPAKNRAPNRF